jgi:hypothetical protein
MCPRFSPTVPDGGGALAGGEVRQTSGQIVQLALPAIDWWWRFDRGVTGERRRRSRSFTASEARTAVEIGAGLNNVLHG